MQGKKFLYYLVNAAGLSYYMNGSVVMTSSVPRPLLNSPDGWQSILSKWERNTTYWGINRNVTNELSFVSDGAKILRYLFYSKNIEEKVYVLIQQEALDIDDAQYAFVHKFFYKGEIDLSTFKAVDINEGYKVNISIAEGGFSKYLKAYENTVFEIPCNATAADVIPVWLDGVYFYNKINYQIPDGLFGNGFTNWALPLVLINEEGVSFNLFRTNENLEEITTLDYVSTSLNYFLQNTNRAYGMRIQGHLTLTNHTDFTQNIKIDLYQNDGFHYTLYDAGVLGIGAHATRTVPFDEFVGEVFPATKFFLIAVGSDYVEISSTDFSLQIFTILEPTLCYALRPRFVFDKLVANITADALEQDGTQFPTSSTLLDANKNLVITSGDAIRGFPTSVVKTSFADFFGSLGYILAAGISYKGTAVEFEQRKKYFDASNPIALGSINKLAVEVAKDFYFNDLLTGYPEQNYDTTNARNEYNSTSEFKSPITRIVKQLSMVSRYRDDSYGIESYRQQFSNVDTEASSTDNSVFILNIEDEPREDNYYHLRREIYSALSGVTTETGVPKLNYNIEQLTPKRILNTNGDFLRSCFYHMDDLWLTFQTTDRNPLLSTTKDGVTVTENANVRIGDLAAPYFMPVVVEFECNAPINIAELLDEDQNRCFTFEYKGQTYKGFNLSIGIAPNDRTPQNFRLLLSADNDLTNLING